MGDMADAVEMTLPSDWPVVVTGASGFVAQHVVRLLLDKGYTVRGTLRDAARESGLRASLELAGVNIERLEFFTADLTRDAGWREALEGAKFVFHIASPVPQRPPRHDSELVLPARDGTLRVLRAAHELGIRRVVMTSSISAVMQGHPRDGSKVFTEADWSIVDDKIPAYDKSKTLAERAAWDFVMSLPDAQRLELVTINPGFILGPSLDHDHGVSNELVRKMIRRDVPGLPDLHFPLVHVLDVAELHWRAMCTPSAAGQRFCCALPLLSLPEIGEILAQAGYRVSRRKLPNWTVRVVGLFDRQVAVILPELGKRDDFDCSRAKQILGWQPRTAQSAVLDAASSLQRHGLA